MSDLQNIVPSSTTITDLANGTVNIDNGTNPQTAQRPINELTTDISSGDDFVAFYDNASASHRREAVRDAAGTALTFTPFGSATITGTFLNGQKTDFRKRVYEYTILYNEPTGNSRRGFTVPNIAGYQIPSKMPTGHYHFSGNLTGYPVAPNMNLNWSFYFNGSAYVNGFNRNVATQAYLSFILSYVRN